MPFTTGIITGLMGYSLQKEMMGDSLFYRELQTFSYDLYSLNLTGFSPAAIQSGILAEFIPKYSGDVNVKVFSVPAEYLFPNDSIRAARFHVEVQVKSTPNLLLWQPQLATPYYSGLDTGFFITYGPRLLDFREAFAFEKTENGTQVFNHNLNFGLLSGNRQIATALASGIFAKDKDTTFGISVMVSGISGISDTSQIINYYTETFDTIRNDYAFTRRREILPLETSTYTYNLTHTLDVKDDGIADVTEKGSVRGRLSFEQAKLGAETLIGSSFTRCGTFLTGHVYLVTKSGAPDFAALVSSPTRVSRVYNKPLLSADYETSYTTNPQYFVSGVLVEETLDINDIALGIVEVRHTDAYVYNKRSAPTTAFIDLISRSVAESPNQVNTYMQLYYPSLAWPLHLIKREFTWPNRKNRGARVVMTYNNHPKYFTTVNGVLFNSLEQKVEFQQPTDITTEFKVINRPNKLSVINYAYQTEKGKAIITLDAGIGRNPDEFITSFRTDIGNYLFTLYRHAATLFFKEFTNIVVIGFTYYVSDVKYVYNSENGTLQLIVAFTYSLKKHLI